MPINTEQGFYNHGRLSEEAIPCTYSLLEGDLYIYLSNPGQDLVIWKAERITGIEHTEIHYQFKYGNGQILIGKGPVAEAIKNHLHKSREDFDRKQGKISSSGLYLIIGVSLLFIAVSTLAYFYLLPWVGEKATKIVSLETEIEIGNNLSETFVAETKTNDSANFYLSEFISGIQLESQYPIQVKVIQSDELNAFALPGGHIFIYTALLQKLNSPEALTALIGHEVTHINERHSLRSIFRALASSLMISVVLGDASGLGSGILAKADEFKQLDYSRALETEADLKGLRLMERNKLNPKGMLDLLEILKAESKDAPELMKYLSTHPDTEDRIQTIKSQKINEISYPENKHLNEIFNRIKKSLDSNK